ncbi:MAG: hydrogenase maturation protease [Desulfobulbaceae bacterium]|jgi:hydrogenase maturation protease|nr:hydrogenase maturation protease [Desulfobulbaceae bacterium]
MTDQRKIILEGGGENSLPFSFSSERKYLTVLGLGNILMADEGFGVHFVRWFTERHPNVPPNVLLMDGGTLGYALLDTIGNCDHLIVIDVLKLTDTPGNLYRCTREEIQDHLPPPTSVHEVKFADVMCKADMLGEMPDTVFLCIVPEQYQEMDLDLTPVLRDKFPVVEQALLKEMARLGITLGK